LGAGRSASPAFFRGWGKGMWARQEEEDAGGGWLGVGLIRSGES